MKLKLPIDVPALFKSANELKALAETPISLSLYIDESAPKPLAAHVRSVFSTESPNVRLAVSYLDEGTDLEPHAGDDLALIIASALSGVGYAAQTLRDAGVPVAVVTLDPDGVARLAQADGHPIPEGDIVSPTLHHHGDDADTTGEIYSPELFEALDKRLGRWVTAACSAKRVPLALAFPFVRKPLARDAVDATSLENAAVGAVNFIPGADLPIMTLNQAKMLLQIATAYGQPLSKDRILELAMIVGSGFLFRAIARQLCSLVPVLGWAIKGAIGYTGTQAIGLAAIEYFDHGGDIVGLAGVVQKARDEAVKVAGKVANSPAGKKVASEAKTLMSDGIKKLTHKTKKPTSLRDKGSCRMTPSPENVSVILLAKRGAYDG